MIINTSSEEEIVVSRKHRKVSVSSEEESLIEYEDDYESKEDINPLFLDIFGTGHEYDYIYEADRIDNQEIEEYKDYVTSEDECCKYVNSLLIGVDEDIVKLLFNNYCPEYIVFQQGLGDISTVYLIKYYIDDYLMFAKYRYKIEKVNLATYSAYKYYKGDQKDLSISGLLDISDYMKNLILGEKIHQPKGILDTDKDYSSVSNQLRSNPVFIDNIRIIYERRILENPNLNQSDIHRAVKSSNELINLARFYSDGSQGSTENDIRKYIIFRAFSSIDSDCYSTVRNFLSNIGAIPGEPEGLQNVINILYSLRGKPNLPYAGIEVCEKEIYIVKIKENGSLCERKTFLHTQIKNIEDFLENSSNIIITSKSTKIKKFLQNLSSSPLYLPNYFSFFSDYKEYSVAFDIASCVQNPAIYFSRALYENKKILITKSRMKEVDPSVLTKAICVIAATDKLDWSTSLQHKYGFTLFKLLDIQLSCRQCDFDHPKSLKLLKEVFNVVEQNKIFTYFKLSNSSDVIDTTNLHLLNYGAFKIICDVAASFSDSKHDKRSFVETVINKPELLDKMNLKEIRDDNYGNLETIAEIIKSKNYHFKGASDEFIFNDVMPKYNENDRCDEVLGTVILTGYDFYIIDVQNTPIFVKKTVDLLINQIVSVRILNPNYSNLNYTGEVLVKKSKGFAYRDDPRYTSNMSDQEIQDKSIPITIRDSDEIGACLVIAHISEKLFFTYKLFERFENDKNVYDYFRGNRRTFKFESLNDFINQFIKHVKNISSDVKRLKHYKKSSKEAIEYMKDTSSEFLKYCIFFSETNPGYLEILIANKHFRVLIEGKLLVLKGYAFEKLEDLIQVLKVNYSKL